MQKRWSIREKPDQEQINQLAAELNIDTVLSTLPAAKRNYRLRRGQILLQA